MPMSYEGKLEKLLSDEASPNRKSARCFSRFSVLAIDIRMARKGIFRFRVVFNRTEKNRNGKIGLLS
jgi:hypothetical protein